MYGPANLSRTKFSRLKKIIVNNIAYFIGSTLGMRTKWSNVTKNALLTQVRSICSHLPPRPSYSYRTHTFPKRSHINHLIVFSWWVDQIWLLVFSHRWKPTCQGYKWLLEEAKPPDSPSNAIFTLLKLIFVKSFWRKAQLFSVSYKNKKVKKKKKENLPSATKARLLVWALFPAPGDISQANNMIASEASPLLPAYENHAIFYFPWTETSMESHK